MANLPFDIREDPRKKLDPTSQLWAEVLSGTATEQAPTQAQEEEKLRLMQFLLDARGGRHSWRESEMNWAPPLMPDAAPIKLLERDHPLNPKANPAYGNLDLEKLLWQG